MILALSALSCIGSSPPNSLNAKNLAEYTPGNPPNSSISSPASSAIVGIL